MELDDILEGNPASEAEKAKSKELNRDESGKFAKGEEAKPELETSPEVEAEEPDDEPEAAPPAAKEKSKESAFLAKANDEKAKRQRLEEQNKQLLAAHQELQRQLQTLQAPKAPDFESDPRGHLQHVRQQAETSLFNEKLNISEKYARKTLGDEVVDEAQAAFFIEAKKNPLLAGMLQQQDDPYGYVVQWHKREQLLAEIGDDPDAYRQRLLNPESAPQKKLPPKSLASASSVRSSSTATPESIPLSNILGR